MAGSPRIDELRKKFDENPRRYFAPLANEYRKMGDYEQAIFICQEFLPQQPGHMSGHIVYGQALFEAGRHDESRAVFETALGLDPENLIALRHLGDIALARGDSVAARAWYQRVLDADPRNEEIAGVLHSIDAQGSGPPAAAAAPPPATPAVVRETAGPTTAPTTPGATLETAPPAGGAQGDELGAIAALEGLQTTDAAAAAGAPPFSSREPVPATPEAPNEAPAPAEPGGFDLDALFRRVEGTAPEPVSNSAVPPHAGGVDFSSAALDLSDAAPFPPAPVSGAFVTETMAELYLRQGHRDQALEVYRQLVAARPGDAALRAKLRELEQPAGAPTVETPAANGGPTIREFLGALAARRSNAGGQGQVGNGPEDDAQVQPELKASDMPRPQPPQPKAPPQAPPQEEQSTIGGSLDLLFGGADRGNAGGAGASPLELAFAHDITASQAETGETERPELPGRPTKPADTELSLDHVFRKPTPASGSPVPGGGGFSFDQFFSQQAQDNGEPSDADSAGEEQPTDGDDIQQFNAWLEGLKKS